MMTRILMWTGVAAAMAASGACQAGPGVQPDGVTIESAEGTPRPPFEFSAADESLLDEIQRGAFSYLWDWCDPDTGMVYDRTAVRDVHVVSVAGVGFQLAALPVAVERGWITRAQGQDRARRIMRALAGHPGNRKAGLYFHFLDGRDGGPTRSGYEKVVSTIDSALLFAGVIVAGQYFGGEVRTLGDGIIDGADWTFFTQGENLKDYERGSVSLGWGPDDEADMTGSGNLLPGRWLDTGAEHRLIYFLAAAAPDPAHRLPAERYYGLRRTIGQWPGVGEMVYLPYSGALFTAFFDHCFIDYAAMDADDPGAFDVPPRASVDWWENSRRQIAMQRTRFENQRPTWMGPEGRLWGLTAMDTAHGYAVPGLFPKPVPMRDAVPGRDYATVHGSGERLTPRDEWGDGTLAPYGAGCTVMFEPGPAIEALRGFYELEAKDGSPMIWRDPAQGGHGFLDSVNLRTNWIGPDYVAIDQGPLVLAIENARSGLIWDLFHQHPAVKAAMERLKLERER